MPLTPLEQELAAYQRSIEAAKDLIASLREKLLAERQQKAELLAACEAHVALMTEQDAGAFVRGLSEVDSLIRAAVAKAKG